MTNDLGQPKVFVKTNLDGFPHAVWGGASVGGAVQCIGSKDGFGRLKRVFSPKNAHFRD